MSGDDQHAADDGYEGAACGLLTTSADGTILRANRTFGTCVGRDLAQLRRMRFQDLLTIGSKLFHQTHWMPLLQMQGSVAEVQLELVCADGRVLPVLVNAALRGQRAPLPGAATAPIDVAVIVATDRRKYERELLLARRQAEQLLDSERRAQEARVRAQAELRTALDAFRTLAENSPDVIVRFDRLRRVAYLSPSAARLTSRPVDSFLGKEIALLGFDPASAAAWARAVEEAFGGSPATISVAVVDPDGARRELQTHVVPERDGGGEVVSVLGMTRDVTAMRREQEEADRRAVFAEQLIGIVSHDLRNPLNAITLGARLLTGADPGDHARVAQRIAASTERANRLIGDLLDFTQARLGGGLRIVRRSVDLHAVVADCADEIRLAWPGRGVEVRASGEGPASVDPDRIAQVVANLANNALTYGHRERPVTVSSIVTPTGAEIRVHNEGRPIPEALQQRIFEPMERGGAEAVAGGRSVGLGLYIVRAIAQAHGGRVEVRSSEGEGTTFAVHVGADLGG